MSTKLLYKTLLDMAYVEKEALANVPTKLLYKALLNMPYMRKIGTSKCAYKTTLQVTF